MKRIAKVFITISLIFVLCLSAVGCQFVKPKDNNAYQTDSFKASLNISFAVQETSQRQNLSLVDAVEKVERSSVMVETDVGKGSGVIVDISVEDGLYLDNDNFVFIITCHHMVSNASTIKLHLADENFDYYNSNYIFNGYIGANISPSAYAVSLVGGDLNSDIAVLKIDLTKPAISGKTLSKDKIVKAQVAPLEQENYKLRRGEQVFAIGNPSGNLPGSISSGVISYIEREVFIDEIGQMMLTQLDVSTQHGSSGGGLYNLYGELIGITNAGSDDYIGINFAIPYVLSVDGVIDSKIGNGFVSIASQLMGTATATNYGYVSGRKQPFGFTYSESGDGGQTSVYVVSVVEGGQASKAGFRKGDIIEKVQINGGSVITISSMQTLSNLLNDLEVGDKIKFQISHLLTSREVVEIEQKAFWFCNTQN